MTSRVESEIADGDLVIRTVPVGPLATNCYVVIDAPSGAAVVIDPGDEPDRLVDAAGDIRVERVLLTHAHWDHVLAIPDVSDAWGASVLGHPDDAPVWPHEQHYLNRHHHFDAGTATDALLSCGHTLAPDPTRALWDGTVQPVDHGDRIGIGRQELVGILTPGHTPGGMSFHIGRHVFTGDTLFPGGPGLTGWPLSDFPTIIDSVRSRLFVLPDSTVVHPGHGRGTTIGAERPHLAEWIARGW